MVRNFAVFVIVYLVDALKPESGNFLVHSPAVLVHVTGKGLAL